VPDDEQGTAGCHRLGRIAQHGFRLSRRQLQVGNQHDVEGAGLRPVPVHDVGDHPLHLEPLRGGQRPTLVDGDRGEVHRGRPPVARGQPQRVAALTRGEVEHYAGVDLSSA
jgi:hypothetical protein